MAGRQSTDASSGSVPAYPVPADSNDRQDVRQSSNLRIFNIQELSACVCADVQMSDNWRRLSAPQATALLQQLPTLAEHACKSRGATTFGQRIVGAVLPHVVEHVAIDLLVRRFPEAGAISGNSVFLRNRVMRVRISCGNIAPGDAVAALRTAVSMVNAVQGQTKVSGSAKVESRLAGALEEDVL